MIPLQFDWTLEMKRLICTAAALAMLFSAGFASGADVSEHQWVRASADGAVEGRVIVPRKGAISAARDAKVTLIDQHGRLVGGEIESDKTGRFTLQGVTPGVYTLMIQGDQAFAVCALHVVSSNVPISEQFEVAAGAVDYKVVRGAMVRYMPSGEAAPVVFDPSSNPLSTDRAQLGQAVRVRQSNGGLKGRLTRAGFGDDLGAKMANVLVYQDGVEVARTVTDAEGNFVVEDLAPGSYSVLGSGQAGFGLMGLELVDPITSATASNSGNEETFVVQNGGPGDTFVMQVAPGPITVIDDQLIEEREVGPAIPLEDGITTYSGGSMGGGGGGAGGGGGLGRSGIAIGLGAAGLAVALADDGDSLTIPPPASPAVPIVVVP